MNSVDVLVICHNGWWSVICPDLEISGYGESQDAATAAFERSFTSTMLGRFRASFMEPQEAQRKMAAHDLPNIVRERGAQIVQRTTITLGQSRAEPQAA